MMKFKATQKGNSSQTLIVTICHGFACLMLRKSEPHIFSLKWGWKRVILQGTILTQPMDPEKKSLNFIFPTKHVIPESLKFSHWLSENPLEITKKTIQAVYSKTRKKPTKHPDLFKKWTPGASKQKRSPKERFSMKILKTNLDTKRRNLHRSESRWLATPKRWRFHDKPRLMGVASHLLSRWYKKDWKIIRSKYDGVNPRSMTTKGRGGTKGRITVATKMGTPN